MTEKTRLLLPILFLLLILTQKGESVWLNLPRSGNKCVTEEIHNNVVVVGDYVVISDDHLHPTPTISVQVLSPYGNVLHNKENVTHGQFAFTASETGLYLTCFITDRPGDGDVGALSVNIDWKLGVAAKDWESVARKEKIEGVELELRKLEGAVEAIHDNLIYLKTRLFESNCINTERWHDEWVGEAQMRGVSETTNSRVAWYSILSLGICVLASCAQVWYLTRFFQKKKLI